MRTVRVDISGKDVEIPVLIDEAYNEEPLFSLDGETALTTFCAEKLAPYLQGSDVILTSKETGSLLAFELSKMLGQERFAVAKKSEKVYVLEGLSISIRTKDGAIQNLYLSTENTKILKGKKVAILDDFVATGGTLLGLEKLVERAGGIVHSKNFVLIKEPCLVDKSTINYLGIIPDLG